MDAHFQREKYVLNIFGVNFVKVFPDGKVQGLSVKSFFF